MKGEVKEEETEQTRGGEMKRVGTGLEEQLKVLLVSISLAITFTVILLVGVNREEMVDADSAFCRDASNPNKCNTSDPFRWGLISSFGYVYSYRLLSAAVLAIQMFLFALFFGMAVFLSLNAQKARGHAAGPLFYLVHDLGMFFCYGCLYVGLVYFMFAVDSFVHIKFPSYRPSSWNGSYFEEIQRQDPPYGRFLAICSWFNLSIAMLTLLFYATVSKVPMLLSSTTSGTKSTAQPQEDVLPPVDA